MPKIFQVVKKVVQTVGGRPATISAGTQTETLSHVGAVLGPMPVGGESASMRLAEARVTVPAGAETAVMAQTAIGTASRAIGAESAAMAVKTSGSTPVPVGSQSASMSARSTITGLGNAANATGVIVSGTTSWQNPGNAKFDDDVTAFIKTLATATAGHSYDARLELNKFGLGTTPAGWTRSKVEVLVRHSWDVSVGALLDTVQHLINVKRDDTGDLLGTIFNVTQNSGDRGALALDTFDVTSLVGSLTDAALQTLRLSFAATANVAANPVGNNSSWNVDSARIRITYTRATIT